jgi:hypothetical protein
MNARTRNMMEVAVAHAQAAFASSCGSEASKGCCVYEGSVWNGGALVTVIIDRGLCDLHRTRTAFADVELWIYDIDRDSPLKIATDRNPAGAALLKELSDADTTPPTQGAPS